MKQYAMVKKRLHEHELDYLSLFAVGWREMHHVVEMVFDRRDPEIKRQAFACFQLMAREAAEAGYGEYRTHISFMDQIASTYGWNGGAMLKFQHAPRTPWTPAESWPRASRASGPGITGGDERCG